MKRASRPRLRQRRRSSRWATNLSWRKAPAWARSAPDNHYEKSGAAIAPSASDALLGADLLLKVRRPSSDELSGLKSGAGLVALLEPYGDSAFVSP